MCSGMHDADVWLIVCIVVSWRLQECTMGFVTVVVCACVHGGEHVVSSVGACMGCIVGLARVCRCVCVCAVLHACADS